MDDNFEKWIAQWDAAQIEIAAEQPPKPPEQQRTSYFNDMPSEYDFEDSGEGTNDDWHNLYQRSMEVDYSSEGLLTDAVNVAYGGSEGYSKPPVESKPESSSKKKLHVQNPVHFASAGNDQEGEDGHVRVTKNWSDGEELQELDDVKKRVEAMERRLHEADVLKKKSERSKLQTELNNLRDRVRKLCEKLVPSAQQDLT